ncbi:MAG: HNH endonuclease [Phyllobacteriaceae bacterium]|jgi:5-methylcytosine-specific restriction endonuclease McrA|nr:HNH endonuclease [Phyllobacteriaceae bacterium]
MRGLVRSDQLHVCLINFAKAGPIMLGPDMPKNKIAKIRDAAFEKQKGHCWYCNQPMLSSSNPALPITRRNRRWLCTAEHLKPKSEGGLDTPDNIRAVCLFCNSTRHRTKYVKQPTRYRAHVQNRIAQGKWHPALLGRHDLDWQL